jgi:diaminopimelate decarboxylase
VEIVGVDMHIGSQLTKTSPFADAVTRVASLVRTLAERNIAVQMVDVGGGLGIRYHDEEPPTHDDYADVLVSALKPLGVTVLLEPGRSIVGNAGALVTRMIYPKRTPEKKFLVVDAAMNDLIRPALYEGHHEIHPLVRTGAESLVMDVVGPVCESGDFFAQDRAIPALEAGERVALLSAGAYGFVMSSTYNSRPLLPEVLVEGDTWSVIRERQTYDDLIRGEVIP